MSNGHCFPKYLAIAAVFSASLASLRSDARHAKFLIPDYTLSPGHRFGVTVPYFDAEEGDRVEPANKLVEVRTGRVLAVIHAETGYDRALNHRETLPSRWSAHGSLLVWEVAGKWFPDALVLLKLKNGQVAWQRNLLTLAQQAILTRTRKAAPRTYAAAKKANAGNGSAYPEGFTIDVETLDPVSLPLRVRVVLTSNPKGLEDIPGLESHLDAMIDRKGNFKVTDFELGHAPARNW